MPLSDRYKDELVLRVNSMKERGYDDELIGRYVKDYHTKYEPISSAEDEIGQLASFAPVNASRKAFKDINTRLNKEQREHIYDNLNQKDWRDDLTQRVAQIQQQQDIASGEEYDKIRQAASDFIGNNALASFPITNVTFDILDKTGLVDKDKYHAGELVIKPFELLTENILGTVKGLATNKPLENPLYAWQAFFTPTNLIQLPDSVIEDFVKPSKLEKAIQYSREKRRQGLKKGTKVDVLDTLMQEGAVAADMMSEQAASMALNMMSMKWLTGAGYGEAKSQIKTLEQAAKFGAWRTLATQGTQEEKLMAGLLTTMYMSTPALSGTFGGLIEKMGMGPAKAQIGRFLLDAGLNLGISEGMKQSYTKAWEQASKESDNPAEMIIKLVQYAGGEALGDVGFALFGENYKGKQKTDVQAKDIQQKFAEEGDKPLTREDVVTDKEVEGVGGVTIRQPQPLELTQKDYDEAFERGGEAQVEQLKVDNQRLGEVETRIGELGAKLHDAYLKIEDDVDNAIVNAFDERSYEDNTGTGIKYNAKTISEAIDGLRKGKGSVKLRRALSKEEYKELKQLVNERGELAKNLTPTLRQKRIREASLRAGQQIIDEYGYETRPTDEKDVVEIVPKTQEEQRIEFKRPIEPIKQEVRDAEVMPETQEKISETPEQEFRQETVTEVPEGLLGLTQRETSIMKEALGFAPYEKVPTEDAQTLAEAKSEGYVDNAMLIAQKTINEKTPLSDKEQYGLLLKYAEKDAKLRDMNIAALAMGKEGKGVPTEYKAEIEKLEGEMEQILTASDIGGSATGRGLRARQMFLNIQTGTLERVLMEAANKKGASLTEKEESVFKELQAEYDKVKAELDEVRARVAENEAIMARDWFNKPLTKKNIENNRKRADLAEYEAQLKQQLKEQGDVGRVREALTGTVQISLESANLIRKLAEVKAAQGITKFDDLMQELRLSLPDRDDRSIWDALGGRIQSEAKAVERDLKKTLNPLNETMKDFAETARLMADIQDAENQNLSAPRRMRRKISDTAKQLRKTLRGLKRTKLQRAWVGREREMLNEKIKEATAILEGYEALPPKEQAKVQDAFNAQLRDTLNDLRTEIRLDQKIADVKEQLETGNFKDITPRQKRAIYNEEIQNKKFELKRLEAKKARAIYELIPGKAKYANEVLSTFKSAKATADMSVLLNQAFVHTINHPIEAAKIFMKHTFPATFSDKMANDSMNRILNPKKKIETFKNGKKYKFETLKEYIKAGLRFYQVGSQREGLEFFQPNLFDRIDNMEPNKWYKKAVKTAFKPVTWTTKAAERNMAMHINMVRKAGFDSFLKRFPEATDGEKEAFAQFLNVVTGEGKDMGAWTKWVMFAPKFAISKPEVLYRAFAPVGDRGLQGGFGDKLAKARMAELRSQLKDTSKTPEEKAAIKTEMQEIKQQGGVYWNRARKQAVKELANTAGRVGLALSIAHFMGMDVGLDPDSSDFLKIKVGDRRWDLFGGYGQVLRLVAQTLMKTGVATLGKQDTNKGDILESMYRFLRYKASVPINMGASYIMGKDAVGREIGKTELALRSAIPLALEQSIDDWALDPTDENIGVRSAASLAQFLGGRTAYYKKKSRKKSDVDKFIESLGSSKDTDKLLKKLDKDTDIDKIINFEY